MATLRNDFCRKAVRLWACALLGLALASSALATDPVYENDAVVTYPGTVPFPPMIDASNFVNNSTFDINFSVLTVDTEFYETWNTINHTNNGSMEVNTGFRFDTHTTNSSTPHVMSGNFYNGGDIQCGSAFFFDLFTFFFGEGKLVVNSTNIINPGSVDIGLDGLLQLTGNTVDLTGGTFTMESALANANGAGAVGIDTNKEWNPFFDLTATTAQASFPFFLFLPDSTAYFNFTPVGTNQIIRVVFVEDFSGSNVAENVYFGPNVIGGGDATVEWIGSYQDAGSGQTISNYLYLNDDYALGASTNVFVPPGGYPDNFVFEESASQLNAGTLASSGFFNVFPNQNISNNYAYVTAQFISTDTATNASATNPSGALTNLPGRVQITANNDLDLSYSTISGQNYLSLQSPYQFEGSAGAQIIAPYADINVGVTNGFLSVSNLMQSQIPNWSGTVQAWSTRFIATDPVTGSTNDFRVLIVGSALNPVTAAYVQDLILHATNSLVISDEFNVLRKLSIDAQNLTLTTNGPGVGATSLDGELNLFSSGIFFQSSLPNLRNLTNSGAIRTLNLAQFFGTTTTVTSTPSILAATASGKLSAVSNTVNVVSGDKVTIGSKTYQFVKTLKNTTANQVKLGTKIGGSLTNLIAAINHASGSGSKYSAATTANGQAFASRLTNFAFTVTAASAGTAGNSIATTTTSTHLTWNSHATLFGGVNAVAGFTNSSTTNVPYYNFINNGILSDQGSTILANYFESGGTFTNGVGSFSLQCQNAVLTNGGLYAGGDIFITADTLVTSNLVLTAGRSLTLQVTNLLTDTGTTNGNIWAVQWTNANGGNGLIVPIKPPVGDLLGTTISNYVAGPAKTVLNIWPGKDYGVSLTGYTNNLAIGRLVLDSIGASSKFQFKGAGISNAIYVDSLELVGQAANVDGANNATELNIGTNIVIYYAQALANGVTVAAKLNHKNGDRLRWVPEYIGQFSSVQIVYPDGSTNTINAALAVGGGSGLLDSDGDGIPNASDPTPLFVSSEINSSVYLTNASTIAVITWDSIPGSTNFVYYSTNMVGPFNQLLTNFVSPSVVPPVGGWPITNSVFDPVMSPSRFYNVIVSPDSTMLYGP